LNTNDIIETLLNPESYPHPVDVITTIETHISIVFLTGQFAYKLKKPVNFGFLDFSKLEQRQHFCRLEFSLNKRSAPELYLGVYGITSIKNQIHVLPIEQCEQQSLPILDYLVKMKQFDPNMVLGRLLKERSIEFSTIDALSQQIADFHSQAEKVDLNTELGDPKIQLQPMVDNFTTLVNYFNDSETLEKLNKLSSWTELQFELVTSTLIQRKLQGFIRACHGDLHLDNITLINHQPVLFDGIEFNEYFRWIDVISDLAFLLIDLDFRKHSASSDQILSLYLSQTLDYKSLFLLDFYRTYRTLVRAKITCLRAQQLNQNSFEQHQVNSEALNYINQALRYVDEKAKPKCILLQGVSGSGKSFFANQLIELLDNFNAIIISSDRIRKTLFGISPETRVSGQQQKCLYSPEMNKKTYRALEEYAETCLENGFNVIIDATFLKLEHREAFYSISRQLNVPSHLFSLQISSEQASQSILNRQQLNTNPSDATIDVMQRQQNIIEAPINSENSLILNTKTLRQVFPKQIIQEFLNLPLT